MKLICDQDFISAVFAITWLFATVRFICDQAFPICDCNLLAGLAQRPPHDTPQRQQSPDGKRRGGSPRPDDATGLVIGKGTVYHFITAKSIKIAVVATRSVRGMVIWHVQQPIAARSQIR